MNCKIHQLGKYRNGKPKYWCSKHQSIAYANDLGILTKCEKFDQNKVKEGEKLYLDPKDYNGGIGLWGALKPVYSTVLNPDDEEGIHVHARNTTSGSKEIDGTYKEVYIKTNKANLFGENDYIMLNSEIATAYTCSMITGKKMKNLSCKNCGAPHIDSGFFSVTYHKKHMCTYCGKEFKDSEDGICNPIVQIKEIFKDEFLEQSILLVQKQLIINQSDYLGGIEIWGSNPAIIWTANRSEEAGIHIHVYKNDSSGDRIFDDTYGDVKIDGFQLDESQIRYLMVQNSMEHLIGRIMSLNCPKCDRNHFDRNDLAIRPHKHHLCEFCDEEFESEIKCVSNPIKNTLKILKENHQILQK
jgi:transposase-like protein